MSNIAIMTDSNCGIMPDEGRDLRIYVLPMPVIIDGQTYYEGIDITLDEFFKKQTEGADITTSQPSPGDVEAMWTELLKTHDEVLFVPMSGGLSNTCQTALMLSGEDEFAGRVFVVNNRRISVTQAQSVLDAKLLAEEGKTASEIKEILEAEALDASIYIAVDTLEYLKKGGRITAAAAAIGTVLKLKPVLTIQGDKLDSFAKARGLKAAFRIMLNAVKNDISSRFFFFLEDSVLKVGIANTLMEPEKLEMFKDEMKKNFPDMELFYLPLTMSIGTHTGPGTLGIGAVRYHKRSV